MGDDDFALSMSNMICTADTQNRRSHVKKHQEENLLAPPGFAPLPTFTLKRVETMDDPSVAIESPHDLEISSVPTSFDLDDTAAIKRSLKFELRPWIVHGEFQTEGESASESKQRDMTLLVSLYVCTLGTHVLKNKFVPVMLRALKPVVPHFGRAMFLRHLGILEGSPDTGLQKHLLKSVQLDCCPNAAFPKVWFEDVQTVAIVKRFQVGGIRRVHALIFLRRHQYSIPMKRHVILEFKDIFKYIDSIRQQAEPYGLCRIIPPPSWKSPCFLEEDEIWQSCKFPTQVQWVNELKNHGSSEKASVTDETRDAKRRKLDYEFGDGCAANFISNECHGEDSQSECGSQFTLMAFKRYADYFQQHYFSREADMSDPKASPAMNQEKWEPSELNIEGEYWRIVEKPTEEIEVLSAANVDCRSFGGGFPLSANPQEESDNAESHASSWDMNSVSRLPGSLLSFETIDSFSHFAPRMHVGMCFSSLPWSIAYISYTICIWVLLEYGMALLAVIPLNSRQFRRSSLGALVENILSCIIIWRVILSLTHILEEKEFFLNISEIDLILSAILQHCIVVLILFIQGRQLSPATLKSKDIPVYRCVQHPREFVLFLPSAYHSGFDCGFNFSASAVLAPLDWLPHGLISIELYREQRRKTSISLDRMLLRAANEAVKAQWECLLRGKTSKWMEACGKDGILARVLRMRIRSEARCSEYLSSASQGRKMDKSFDDSDKKWECSTCCCDLYLSAASCPCNPNRFSCLRHSKRDCSCPWSDKIFLFRYLISELEILVEAVEGKMSAVRRWVKEDLGLALYQENPNKTQNGSTQYPSCVEGPNRRTVLAEEDKASAMKLLGEASMGNLKGKELATSTLSDSSGDSTSSSSSDLDIEAYVARLEALKRGKLHPSVKNEGESGLKQTRESDTQLNSCGSSVPEPVSSAASDKGNACQIDDIICVIDDDD
ncbi:hypothetical protein Cgig2_033036 [Carnegiea gigantea]|uniref:Uncharacterized protein n=1 Tax=Carnegiea gigantea TaxID=171969 RepID=A0A9Q1K7L2_9CARY|nr:hypothetical protein Cgig2_033036 [Carnegiea gigantea]